MLVPTNCQSWKEAQFPNVSKVNQVSYSSAHVSLASSKAFAQIVLEVSCWQEKHKEWTNRWMTQKQYAPPPSLNYKIKICQGLYFLFMSIYICNSPLIHVVNNFCWTHLRMQELDGQTNRHTNIKQAAVSGYWGPLFGVCPSVSLCCVCLWYIMLNAIGTLYIDLFHELRDSFHPIRYYPHSHVFLSGYI